MRSVLDGCVRDFKGIPELGRFADWTDVRFDFSSGSHLQPKPFKKGHRSVYLFFDDRKWLKVGQTNYAQRYTSQHYGTKRSVSSLSKDLWAKRTEFKIECDETEIDIWMLSNLGRANFVFPTDWPPEVPKLFETYLHFRLKPRFEGKRK